MDPLSSLQSSIQEWGRFFLVFTKKPSLLLLLNCSSRNIFFGLKEYAGYSATYNFVSTLSHKVLRNEDTANINGTVTETTR